MFSYNYFLRQEHILQFLLGILSLNVWFLLSVIAGIMVISLKTYVLGAKMMLIMESEIIY